MNYFVVAPDGQKYGPVDLAGLNEWAQRNRVLPSTIVEDGATGTRMQASTIQGIIFPPTMAGGLLPPSPYASYPRMDVRADNGSGDMTLVWMMSVLTLGGSLCCPIISIVTGIVAITMAVSAKKKGHPQAQTGFVVAIVCTVLGVGWYVGLFAYGMINAMAHPIR